MTAHKNDMSASKGRLVPALTRGLGILELFLRSDLPMTASEISERSGLPRTTTHELVQTLIHCGYLVSSDEGTRRYSLGPAVLALGYRYQMSLDIGREGSAVAEEVSAASGETVHIAVLENSEVLYIAKADSIQNIRMVSHVGGRLPAHVTAVGKALLAALSEDEQQSILSSSTSLPALTAASVTDPSLLLAELREAAERGVAFERGESNPHIGCVAAPVRDRSGHVVAAISISTLLSGFDDTRAELYTTLVLRGAAELSRRLGWIDAR